MQPILRFFLLCLLAATQAAAQNSRYVNVFIGTDGTGHCFPGPSMPFGMVQPGPDNRDRGWNHTSGYQFHDTLLLGFSQTRFSGTGINEMGDVLLLPVNPQQAAGKNAYYKQSEKASPGYYTLTKKDEVRVELTCSDRVAFHRYTFPGKEGRVLADLQHGLRFVMDEAHQKDLVVASDVKVEDDRTISGYCSTRNWVNRTYYFVLRFDKPFRTPPTRTDKAGHAPQYQLDFSLGDTRTLEAKIALSTVSVEGARKNMQAEIPHWDFDRVRTECGRAWNRYLDRVRIEAPPAQKEIFYTSLYHLFLQPSNIADVDGQYRGVDDRVAQAPNGEYYSTLSIWDVYRGAFPLLQLLAPEKINGIVRTLLLHHKAKGFLPIWTAWGQDNYCMIGNHAIPMLLSAYRNGFRGFDVGAALQAMVETSTRSHINSNWELYNRYGYYPLDSLDNESVSRTLESGYDDWCVASLATELGRSGLADTFYRRSRFFQNLFDRESSFFRGKDSHGRWRTPFFPLKATSPLNNPGDYTEANAWQYFWTPCQYATDEVAQLLGGKEKFRQKLDEFFTLEAENPDKFLGQEAMIGQYAHGNEPSHHIVYLYAFTDRPQRGQELIHRVINEFHQNTPDGMIGNDDCGQMSAWYILSTLGFYPVNPANGEFVLGSPQVKKAEILLGKGKRFTMQALSYSPKAIYNEKRTWNGRPLTTPVIRFSTIRSGGTLTFQMREP